MIDFTVKWGRGAWASENLLRVMVSKDRRTDRMFRFYVEEMVSVFRLLAEEFNADIERECGESYFIIHSSELAALQAAIMGHGCSVQLLDTCSQ